MKKTNPSLTMATALMVKCVVSPSGTKYISQWRGGGGGGDGGSEGRGCFPRCRVSKHDNDEGDKTCATRQNDHKPATKHTSFTKHPPRKKFLLSAQSIDKRRTKTTRLCEKEGNI